MAAAVVAGPEWPGGPRLDQQVWHLVSPPARGGEVEMLDVFTGKVSRVTDTYDGFVAEVNDRAWQEVYLLSELVFRLHQEGKVAGPGQCFALAPHPALGGPNPLAGDPVDPRFVMVMDIGIWQNLCIQSVLGSAAGPAEQGAAPKGGG